jgi:hypothetical protein
MVETTTTSIFIADEQMQRHQVSHAVKRSKAPPNKISLKPMMMQLDQKSGQIRPVTTARKDTNSTAATVNITVSAVSPHRAIGAAASAVVSTGSAGKAAGVSLNIRGPFGMT